MAFFIISIPIMAFIWARGEIQKSALKVEIDLLNQTHTEFADWAKGKISQLQEQLLPQGIETAGVVEPTISIVQEATQTAAQEPNAGPPMEADSYAEISQVVDTPVPKNLPVPILSMASTPMPIPKEDQEMSPPTSPTTDAVVSPPKPEKSTEDNPTPQQESQPPTLENITDELHRDIRDWEYWLGSRGAALLGGLVLAMAGLFLFKYSLEKGLVTPSVRVLGGMTLGLVSLAASHILRRTDNILPANATAGGGIVALYGATYAAAAIYHMINIPFAFVLMVCITVTCGWLSARYKAIYLAGLGMVGGFATPVMLSTGENNLIFLFGYLFFLNLGVIYQTRQCKWPIFGQLGGLITLLFQAAVILQGVNESDTYIMLAVSLVFMGLYGFYLRDKDDMRPLQLAGLIAPFLALFGMIHLAANPLPAPLVYTMVVILTGGSLWQARKLNYHVLLFIAAMFGALLIIGQGRLPSEAMQWVHLLCITLITGMYVWFIRTEEESEDFSAGRTAGLVFILITLCALPYSYHAWPTVLPWMLGVLILGAGAWNAMAGFVKENHPPIVGILAAVNIWCCLSFPEGPIDPDAYTLIAIGMVGIAQFAANFFPDPSFRKPAEADGMLMAMTLIAIPVYGSVDDAPMIYLATMGILGVLAAFGSMRYGSGAWYSMITVFTAVHLVITTFYPAITDSGWGVLALLLTISTVFTLLPFIFKGDIAEQAVTWRTAALASPLMFPAVYILYEAAMGPENMGMAAILPGMIALAGLWLSARSNSTDSIHRVRLVWFSAVAAGFLTLAIPLQLEREWLTIGWALQAAAMAQLWRRFNHPGLKYLSAALTVVVSLRLIGNPALLGYHEQAMHPIFNWVMYTYLVPIAAMFFTATRFQNWEAIRFQSNGSLFPHGKNGVTILNYAAAVITLFVYLNLAVLIFFNNGTTEIDISRLPARDMVLSLVWILYAIGLVAAGIRTRFRSIRRVGLAFLLLAVTKVFLYDLGVLTDLYRVASLLGLAVTLMGISVVYKKFVTEEFQEEVQ